MIFLYRIAFVPLFLLAIPYYGFRMLRRGGYLKDFSHRFGGQKDLPKPANGIIRVWIQAVSVGEVEALSSLLKLMHESGRYEVVVTTTTSTGYKILSEKYSQYCIYTGIFPLDFYFFNRRAWKKIKPDICVLMEGELWPEHMHRAKSKKAPILLLNARLSDRTFLRYSKFKRLAKRLLGKIDFIGAGSEFDMERFIALGVEPSKISLTGNLKFDSKPEKYLNACEKLNLKKKFGFEDDSLVMLGSSTWRGEEKMLLEAAKKIASDKLRLLIVPRHAERRAEIRALLEKESVNFHFRSDSKDAPHPVDVYVGDTTGELRILTQIADFAFVGKSLPPNEGGQTPIDCAALGVAIVYGPKMTNFKLLCKALEEANAVLRASDEQDAVVKLARLAADPKLREELAAKACAWHSSNLGASEKTLKIIRVFSDKIVK